MIINNALSGALAAQTALNTASQNIANVMTPGYTRQGALLASVQLASGNPIAPGDGVKVPSLIRFSDSYKNLQMWLANSELGRRAAAQPYITQLEQVMGNDAGSINSGLDFFFSALNAASVEPTSAPLRQQVITAADALSQRFNSLRQVFSIQRVSTNNQRRGIVDQINALTTDVASLNKKIAESNASGVSPSGLLDERDRKIDALANLVGIQVIEQPDGSRTVTLRDGQPLVAGTRAATLKVEDNIDGSQTLNLVFADKPYPVANANLGGQLGGLDEFETNVLTPLTESIKYMAQSLADGVNAQLGSGYKMDGTSGTDLFVFNAGSATALLTIKPGIEGKDLAFSAHNSEPGNSENLLKLIGLKDKKLTDLLTPPTSPVDLTSLGSVLLGDVYTQKVGQLGTDSEQNQAALKIAETVRNQAEESWKSTSGVNNDEEAMNLVQYQQMYQANMKVIAVANQLFDSTLAMLG